MNKLILFIFLAILPYVLTNFYVFVLNPSILSYKTSCEIPNNEIGIEYCNVQGWYDPSTDEIIIKEDAKNPDMTSKHEKCHRRQTKQKRLSSCNNKIGSILNEMECYLISGESFDAFKNLRLK